MGPYWGIAPEMHQAPVDRILSRQPIRLHCWELDAVNLPSGVGDRPDRRCDLFQGQVLGQAHRCVLTAGCVVCTIKLPPRPRRRIF